MYVRLRKDEDLEAITKLEEECFTDSWSPALMSGMFASEWDKVYVLEDEGRVIGYADVRNMYGDCDLMSICVAADSRGRGGASLLMERIMEQARLEDARQMMLEVRRSNEPAIALYKKFGFTVLGARRGYYSNPVEDAIIMIIEFKEKRYTK